jgi:hypothetical protein
VQHPGREAVNQAGAFRHQHEFGWADLTADRMLHRGEPERGAEHLLPIIESFHGAPGIVFVVLPVGVLMDAEFRRRGMPRRVGCHGAERAGSAGNALSRRSVRRRRANVSVLSPPPEHAGEFSPA